jgi:Kef-type K+ transport system membrane component KefB/nucleotide-binding universal stress UspA family protein
VNTDPRSSNGQGDQDLPPPGEIDVRERPDGGNGDHEHGGLSEFGHQGRGRIVALYVGLLAVALLLMQLVLHLGSGLRAPAKKGGGATGATEAIDVHHVFWKLLLAIALVIVVARLVGALFRRFGQPQVMGEIVAGILLGPSVLGAVWPSASSFIFTREVMPFINVLAEIGLIFFMFLIGVELDVRLIRGRGHAATLVSHVSILAPFVTGLGLALVIFEHLGSEEGKFVPFALFLGASMSITAFPVLARILSERRLNKTRLGAVTLTCAAVDDVTAWCMLAVVVAVSAANGIGGALVTIGLALLFIAGMIVIVRPILGRLATYFDERGSLSPTLLAVLFVGIVLSALATDRIGIHAIFGAFLFGAIMPNHSEFIEELTAKLEDFAVIFLLPLFFAYSGLRTEIGQLGTDPQLWLFCGLIIAVAIVGKWGGSSIAARMVGLDWRESLALGILMNCRGLTELVILNIGLDLGVIPPPLFAMLVIMALVTTFMTTPILGRIYPPEQLEAEVREAEGADEDEDVWRVLVHVPSLDHAYELVHTALSLAGRQDQHVEMVLVRTLAPGYSDLFGHTRVNDGQVQRARRALQPLVLFAEGAGVRVVPMVIETAALSDTLVGLVAERKPDLVLMSWRQTFSSSRLRSGMLGQVLQDADADVAILIDPANRGTSPRPGSDILVPYGGGFHESTGLDLARRIARTHGARVRLLTDADTARTEEVTRLAGQAIDSGVETSISTTPGDIVQATIEGSRNADLVVMGVSDEWAENRVGLGRLRELVASHSRTPMLVVRRHGQHRLRGPRRWFGRRTEWMEDAATTPAKERAEQLAS